MTVQYELPHMGGATLAATLAVKLVAELRHGEYSKADRLPAEVELAEHFGVSRSVIRDVLSTLEREGFVERGRGIGTIIHRDIVNMTNRLDVKFEYNELVRGTGYQPFCDNLTLYEKPADEDLAEQLDIDTGETVIVCEKRILAGSIPVIFSIDHLPKSFFAGMDYRQMNWSGPIFDLLEDHFGIVVDTDIAKISAAIGPPHIRRLLNAGQEEALIFIDEVGYYKFSYPIIQTLAYYTNFFDFTMLRKKM